MSYYSQIFLLAISLFVVSLNCQSQSLEIFLDGEFTEWTDAQQNYNDTVGDNIDTDFKSLKLANDEEFLYLNLELAEEKNLTDYNRIFLYIDVDLDSSTGYDVNGIGAELIYNWNDKKLVSIVDGLPEIRSLNEFEVHTMPTIYSRFHEIAIPRSYQLNSGDILSLGDDITLLWKDWTTPDSDVMPDTNGGINYSFDNEEVPIFEAIDLAKNQEEDIRLMSYNMLFNAITDPIRIPALKRILNATKPQIITFNECWDVSTAAANNLLNETLPLADDNTWNSAKIDGGNITASVYPIIQNWQVLAGRRITASLIDLPDFYGSDLVVINCHLKCCDGDATRQQEVDAIAHFIEDAKSLGGNIDLEENTPIIISGDMNFVNESGQLNTLVTGEIENTLFYGSGSLPDWDNSTFVDLISPHTDRARAFTWEDDGLTYLPGRLDYFIYSDSVIEIENNYTLETSNISFERLSTLGLEANDTRRVSDHLPKITDFKPKNLVSSISFPSINMEEKGRSFPNPFSDRLYFEIPTKKSICIEILNINGDLIYESYNSRSISLDTKSWPNGIYVVQFKTQEQIRKTLLLKTE